MREKERDEVGAAAGARTTDHVASSVAAASASVARSNVRDEERMRSAACSRESPPADVREPDERLDAERDADREHEASLSGDELARRIERASTRSPALSATFIAETSAWRLSELAQRNDGYHRVPLTDALIAAAAAEHGGLPILHSDAR